MPDTPAVAIEGLSFSYDGNPVLTDVSLTIRARHFVGVVGPNGGGKTTLLKLILGIHEPGTGSIKVSGEAPRSARRRLGYVPQYFRFDPQFPITVLDVVRMGRLGAERSVRRGQKADREAALDALALVDLEGAALRPFNALSGGQRQRALIARALASAPVMLLLDEPTANLDPVAERELYSTLERLNHEMTILLVTHDLAFVSRCVESVLCVNGHVTWHPTCDIGDLNGELMARMFGRDVRWVRHDRSCREGAMD